MSILTALKERFFAVCRDTAFAYIVFPRPFLFYSYNIALVHRSCQSV